MGSYGYAAPQIPTPAGLGFGAAIKEVFSKYGVFRGRATRSEFWWWQLFLFLVPGLTILLGFILAGVAGAQEQTYGSSSEGMTVFAGLLLFAAGLVGLAFLVPTIAVSVRRLHDMDLSGWLYLIILIPSVGGIILFVMMLMPSKPHPNQYGLAPTPQF